MGDLTAVILCGGRGSRMGVDGVPKCLTVIAGKPMLQWIMDDLRVHVARFVVCVGYRAGSVNAWLAHYQAPCPVISSNAGEDVSMAARLMAARQHFDGDALICYGDEWADVDIPSLKKKHSESRCPIMATVMVPRLDWGIFSVDSSGVCRFEEKPAYRDGYANIGYTLMSPEAWKIVRALSMSDLDKVFIDACALNQVALFVHEGRRFTVNTSKDVIQAEEAMIK